LLSPTGCSIEDNFQILKANMEQRLNIMTLGLIDFNESIDFTRKFLNGKEWIGKASVLLSSSLRDYTVIFST